MALKPRQSVLDLFDPLLSDALHVPLPDTPPQTPGCLDDEKSQDMRLPEDLGMLFLDHFSERKGTFSPRTQRSGRLVDIDDEDTGSEVIDMEPFQHDVRSSTTEKQSSFDITVSPCSETMNKSRNIETTMSILVCPDVNTPSEPLVPISQTSPHENRKVMTYSIGYLNPPSQTRDRRRSSIDISMSLSSFSSSVQGLPGSNIDLIKEELFPLAAFSEEDSFQSLDEVGTCTFSIRKAEEATSLAHKSTELEKKNTGASDDQKPETPLNEKYSRPLSAEKGSYHTEMTSNLLRDTSNSQTIYTDSSTKFCKESEYRASSHFDIVIPAPRKPKVFTLNRYQSFKPQSSLESTAGTNDVEDRIPAIPSKALHRPIIPPQNRNTGNASGKTIHRPQRMPIVKHATALESKIPSRAPTVPYESTNTNQAKVGTTVKTFGGPSRIAVPLKKGVRRTAS